MRLKKLWTTITLTTYLFAFVLADLSIVFAQTSSRDLFGQTTSRDEVTNVARDLGVTRSDPAAPKGARRPTPSEPTSVGVPSVLNSLSPLSAAVLTAVGGRDTQFSEISLLADWDGKEDLTADRGVKIDDFSFVEPDIDATQTRTAVSAHTAANGFNENVYYYGDSIGNVFVGVDTDPESNPSSAPAKVDTLHQINLPSVLNAFGTLNSDDQIVVTGICVSPVVDLTSWANVNGSFAPFTNKIGEALIVTFWDTGGGLRLSTNNQIVRSGVLAFPIADDVSPAAAPPGILSPAAFPVTVGGAFGVAFSTFSNLAGCAVDDDGSVYFQQVDLQQFTGANIVKISRTGINQDRSVATNGFLTISSLNPAGGVYGTATGPVDQVNRFTNYSGTSTTFGNIAALAAGPGNTLYAAMAASSEVGSASTGLFVNNPALGPTPSMIVSFADAIGVHAPSAGVLLPDGFADAADGGSSIPGVNNFRVFVHGSGPDRRGSNTAVFGTVANTLKLDLQVDYTIYSGLAVNEDRQVFVIHGGTPAGVGRNPSVSFGEIQVFTDQASADRRADYIDLRGDLLPNPPVSGGNDGDADSDRFDHIFMQAPLDGVSATPTGLAGLSRGFLRYTNRLAPNPISPGLTLGQTQRTQADDISHGPIFFGAFDPGLQVAGGDDLRFPFTGDDAGSGGSPPMPASFPPYPNPGAVYGGFEFNFGATVGVCTAPWNAFFLNSNGSVSFNAGDAGNVGSADALLTGVPRIAPVWSDWLMPSRSNGALNTFPIQALGFAGVNHFKVRWINAPRFGAPVAAGSRNTFSVSLFDDGTTADENGAAAVEGPTEFRFLSGPSTIVGVPARPEGSARYTFEYGWMDSPSFLAGDGIDEVTGYSVGGLVAGSVAEINLSEVGRTTVIGAGAASEVALFEVFTNDFDLRSEGNDAVASTPPGQPNANREVLDFFGKACATSPLTLFTAVTGSGTVSGPGISCPGDCSEVLPSGTLVALVATPGPGFAFSNWVGCDSPSGNVCSVFMNDFKLVTAQFVAVPAQPLSADLNQSAYTTGDTLVLGITLDASLAGPGPVDAYIVVDLPGGAGTYSLQLGPAFAQGQVPIAAGFVPFPFSGVLLSVVLPGSLPAGTYQWRTFLTEAGTLNVIGSVDVTPFTFTP